MNDASADKAASSNVSIVAPAGGPAGPRMPAAAESL